jgi:hypothetical protein
MAPPGLAGLVGREDRGWLVLLVALEVREGLEVLEPLGGLVSGVLEQPDSIRPIPARIPKPDRRRLRTMVELLSNAFTAFASSPRTGPAPLPRCRREDARTGRP